LYDYKIIFEEGKQLGFRVLYRMSQNELQILWKYLNKMLSEGFIKASFSLIVAPVIFVKKPSSGLHFCVDY